MTVTCTGVPWLSTMVQARSPSRNLNSGCWPGPTGIVPCDPEAMRARAEAALGRPLSMEVYSLARNVASEVGTGMPAEKIAVAEAAINRAHREGLSIARLVMRDGTHYAKQSGTNPAVSSSQDPSADDVAAAEIVLSGRSHGFARGATHYFAPRYYSEAALRELFERWTSGWGHPTVGLAWVGPLAGVRPRELFLMRPMAKNSAAWAQMRTAGLAAALHGEAPGDVCQRNTGTWIAAGLGLAALGGAAWYVWRRR